MEIINWCQDNLFLVSVIFNLIITIFLVISVMCDKNIKNQNKEPLEIVVCAANRHLETGDIILGVRHFDKLMHMQIVNSIVRLNWEESEQGFVNQRGKFLTREQAWIVAEKAGQIAYRCGGDGKRLYSENLY